LFKGITIANFGTKNARGYFGRYHILTPRYKIRYKFIWKKGVINLSFFDFFIVNFKVYAMFKG